MLVWGIVFVGVLVLAGAGFVGLVYVGAWGKLPDYEELRHIQNAEASVVLTEDGEVMGKYYIENRTNIHYKNLPEHAINALIATEDVRFYQHEGIDKISMARVFFKTFLLGKRSAGGGSTISQQLAKNLYPREEQDVPLVHRQEVGEYLYEKRDFDALPQYSVVWGEYLWHRECCTQILFCAGIRAFPAPSRYVGRHVERSFVL